MRPGIRRIAGIWRTHRYVVLLLMLGVFAVSLGSAATVQATSPPTVSGVSPSSGPAAGGTSVTITGTGFTGSTGVNFGSTPASNVSVVDDSHITATSPAGTGTVDVTVTGGPNGDSSANPPADQFTYQPPPTVTGVSPNHGPQAGGTNVTITGTGFTGSTDVKFGTNAATNVVVVDDTHITATSPAGTGTVDVTVTGGPNGDSSANPPADQFTYQPPPTVTGVSPNHGPQAGGTSVTITGTGFTGSTGVNFGSTPASNVSVVDDSHITATSPAGTGTVDVTVTGGPNGDSSANPPADQFTYQPPPTVTGVSPNHGPQAGGTNVTITGTGFTGSTDVKFGTNAATNVVVVDDTHITATSPAGTGTVDVTVTGGPNGDSSANPPADQFTYQPPPTVTGVSPNHGPQAGGTSVTITGTGFTGSTGVNFGSTPASNVSVVDDSHITATSPAGTGTVDVTVTGGPNGDSSANPPADQFTYGPTVTSISPTAGPAAGGTTVTIHGTGFANNSTVKFGSTTASSVSFVNSTQLTAPSPAGTGTVHVTVTTGSETSPTSSADQFTYGPTNISAPTISGNPQPGQTLTCSQGSWTGSGNTYTYQWNRDGSPITGASNPTYIVQPADVRHSLTCTVTATNPGGSAAKTSSPVNVPGPSTGSPRVVAFSPLVESNHAAGVTGEVNPEGLPTTAYYVYGLDARYQQFGITIYNLSTTRTPMGSDFASHPLSASISGLLPNAQYHARLVAVNSAGTTIGPDETFTTKPGPRAHRPRLGRSVNLTTTRGVVFVVKHGTLVPLTQTTQVPVGTEVVTTQGTVRIVAATGRKGATYTGTFTGGVFRITQSGFGANRGLTMLTLVNGGAGGAPSRAGCTRASKQVLQALQAHASGRFRVRSAYAQSTGQGTRWTTWDRCDGTLVAVSGHAVQVTDRVRRITKLIHAGGSYLALAHPPKKKKHK